MLFFQIFFWFCKLIYHHAPIPLQSLSTSLLFFLFVAEILSLIHSGLHFTKQILVLMWSANQHRRRPFLSSDWLTRGGRGCRDSKDVRAHLKTCCSQIHNLAHDPTCFYVGTGDDVVLKQDS